MIKKTLLPTTYFVLLFVILHCQSIDIKAQTLVDVSGQVTDSNGAVIPNAIVTARNTETGFSKSTVTNESGFYRITGLPPGEYNILVESQGVASQKRIVNLVPNQLSLVNFVIGPTPYVTVVEDGSIKLFIKSRSKEPVREVRLTITINEKTETFSVQPKADGSHLIESLFPGKYRIKIEAEGYEPVEKTIRVRSDKISKKTFKLRKTK